MNHERCQALLSDLLDGHLEEATRVEVERHVASCAECRAELEDYRTIVAMARSYEAPAPTSDPWESIARRAASTGRWRASRVVGLALAASLAGLLSVYAVRVRQAPSSPGAEPTFVRAAGTTDGTASDDTSYARQVGELERVFAEARDRLDPRTVEVVEQSLRQIEDALAQAAGALEKDPNNELLHMLLERSREQKLHLLEDVRRSL